MSQQLKNFKNFCEKCPKRDTCTELCIAAEVYAGQDYVSQRNVLACDLGGDIERVNGIGWKDLIPTHIDNLDMLDWINFARRTKMTKSQKKYLYLSYWKRKSKTEIARRFGTSRQNVSQIIKRVKVEIGKNK